MKIGALSSVFCSTLLLAASTALAAPAVEWTSALLAADEQRTYGVVPVADGYVVGGYHLVQPGNPRSGGSMGCSLAKTGLDGSPLWQQFYQPALMGSCNGLAPADDDGFLLAGGSYANYYYAYGRGVLIKTDAAGNELWMKYFDANNREEFVDTTWAEDVRQTADGGFIVLATRAPIDLPDSAIMLLKVDADGNEIWRTFPGDRYAQGYRIGLADDGGFIVSGFHFDGAAYRFYLLRTDAAGQPVWSADYPLGPFAVGVGVRQTADGGFAAVGYAGDLDETDSTDAVLLKVDAAGAQQWSTTFGARGDDWGSDLVSAPDGGFVVTGSQRSPEGADFGAKLFLVKFSAAGEKRWEMLMNGAPAGENGYAEGNVIEPTADGGAIVGGEMSRRDQAVETSVDFWLVKIGPEQLLPTVEVRIDVKPGSASNPINLKAQGTVPVAILTTSSFDADMVARDTVRFAGAAVALKPNGKAQGALEDVDGDGDQDLVLHFDSPDLQLAVGDGTATLTGATRSGIEISGVDAVEVKSEAVGKK